VTKKVRIENADSADYQVVVQVFDKREKDGEPDALVNEVVLSNPCDITGDDIYLTSTRYLVVKEVDTGK